MTAMSNLMGKVRVIVEKVSAHQEMAELLQKNPKFARMIKTILLSPLAVLMYYRDPELKTFSLKAASVIRNLLTEGTRVMTATRGVYDRAVDTPELSRMVLDKPKLASILREVRRDPALGVKYMLDPTLRPQLNKLLPASPAADMNGSIPDDLANFASWLDISMQIVNAAEKDTDFVAELEKSKIPEVVETIKDHGPMAGIPYITDPEVNKFLDSTVQRFDSMISQGELVHKAVTRPTAAVAYLSDPDVQLFLQQAIPDTAKRPEAVASLISAGDGGSSSKGSRQQAHQNSSGVAPVNVAEGREESSKQQDHRRENTQKNQTSQQTSQQIEVASEEHTQESKESIEREDRTDDSAGKREEEPTQESQWRSGMEKLEKQVEAESEEPEESPSRTREATDEQAMQADDKAEQQEEASEEVSTRQTSTTESEEPEESPHQTSALKVEAGDAQEEKQEAPNLEAEYAKEAESEEDSTVEGTASESEKTEDGNSTMEAPSPPPPVTLNAQTMTTTVPMMTTTSQDALKMEADAAVKAAENEIASVGMDRNILERKAYSAQDLAEAAMSATAAVAEVAAAAAINTQAKLDRIISEVRDDPALAKALRAFAITPSTVTKQPNTVTTLPSTTSSTATRSTTTTTLPSTTPSSTTTLSTTTGDRSAAGPKLGSTAVIFVFLVSVGFSFSESTYFL
eukprot:gnl/TRDRNA2_/TRDRNA2_38319_c0_seq2.p1 gnl/TRDRNA2_/TRDRNA2_38319_c0~~gnl/TRDRNA2_/TRDRNA2_38319_c0_seq2.p1  ORF type:complete len:776 (-),score=175.03 gnl/TRDRNA2_/TRDRNA2_38319_c0_seq2:43-2100(-)